MDLKTFSPGVRIDWTAGAVELDATIVLREGPLELIACSPKTREHESILVTKAKPTQVFQAMGLVGLTPGLPVTYDEKKKRWRPPTGERLRVAVKCRGDRDYIPLRTWVVDPKTKNPPANIPWVFAGSRTLPDGRFLADLDGTILCLVDFDSALITVGALHTADNTSLWLASNTEAIPPIGTACTIRIKSQNRRIIARFGANGQLTRNNRPVSVESVAAMQKVEQGQPAMLIILCDSGVSKDQIDSLRSAFLAKGAVPSRLSIRRRANTAPDKK